jgi:hypothetical protein
MATVRITIEAQQQLERLPRTIQQRMQKLASRLEDWPAWAGQKLSQAAWRDGIGYGRCRALRNNREAMDRAISWDQCRRQQPFADGVPSFVISKR